ncbi:MAG: GNAT family N-acetyltransferase [Haloarculaceae archaeon]
MRIRRARRADADDVAEFTADVWSDRGGDYVDRAFSKWVDEDGERARTFVAAVEADDGGPEPEGTVVGLTRGVLLSEWEAWAEGMRVAAAYRGQGVARALTEAVFAWAVERGAAVVRNMVFSWNGPGLGTSRGVGFEPGIECRWARPDPNPEADVGSDYRVTADPEAAWAFWTRSDARRALDGLALDFAESWALAALTRERLRGAADGGDLLVLQDGDGTHAFAAVMHEYERDGDDGPTRWAEYGVSGWRDRRAGRALFSAVARDAADRGRDRTRVLIPETARHVSDVAALGVELRDDPVFVMEADVSGRAPEAGTDGHQS